jgi:hypothetical protein
MTIEEVTEDGSALLFEYDGGRLEPTPRLARGNSRFVASIARPGETYADAMAAIEERADSLEPTALHRSETSVEGLADA